MMKAAVPCGSVEHDVMPGPVETKADMALAKRGGGVRLSGTAALVIKTDADTMPESLDVAQSVRHHDHG